MKAIVLAAGAGKRLRPFTHDRPKCMVPLQGKPILWHQAEAFAAVGARDLVVVRGHAAQSVQAPGARFIENPRHTQTNILGSFLCALGEVDGPCLVSYGDIAFAPDVVTGLCNTPGDIVLTIDVDWALAYRGRTEHPVEQAELAVVREDRIVRVGKIVTPSENPRGEYIGLLRCSAAGAQSLREFGERVRSDFAGRENEPFAHAERFSNAYLCDLLQHMADAGVVLRAHDIHGRWREIDTQQDYERAERDIDWL